jgi:hypothetical protein
MERLYGSDFFFSFSVWKPAHEGRMPSVFVGKIHELHGQTSIQSHLSGRLIGTAHAFNFRVGRCIPIRCGSDI